MATNKTKPFALSASNSFRRQLFCLNTPRSLLFPGHSCTNIVYFVDLGLAMIRKFTLLVAALAMTPAVYAQNMILSIDQDDFIVTNVFSDVDIFSIDIEFDVPVSRGSFIDPDIINVTYRVNGTLVAGTPSGFPAFALERIMTGDEFYAQGSSISFEVASNAVLSDGVQVAELVGNGIVFTFNGKEVDNMRYHPTLFELNSDGTGMMQNSDNIITLNPLDQVAFGSEYINTLAFDPGNTTLLTGFVKKKSGGGPIGIFTLFGLLSLLMIRQRLWLKSR